MGSARSAWFVGMVLSMGTSTACSRCDDARVRDASPAASASMDRAIADASTPDVSVPLVWPSFDDEKHCASLRKIVGYLELVPQWTSDAGYLTGILDGGRLVGDPLSFGDDVTEGLELERGKVRGKEIPSGFSACTFSHSTEIRNDWASYYHCTTSEAPSEAVAHARFVELRETWRRCLKSTGWRFKSGKDWVSYSKKMPPGERSDCSFAITGTTLRMDCGKGSSD